MDAHKCRSSRFFIRRKVMQLSGDLASIRLPMCNLDEKQSKEEFLNVLSGQLVKEHQWESNNFFCYHIAMWLSIVISFCSTILAAFNLVSSAALSILSAATAVVLLLDKKFMFPQRWRWHNERRIHLEKIRNQINFEGLSIKEASASFNDLIISMERNYPTGIDIIIHAVAPKKDADDGSAADAVKEHQPGSVGTQKPTKRKPKPP